MTTGERIKDAAEEKKMNLHQLAVKAGISYNTLYSIVRRRSDKVDVETLRKIALALEMHPIEIMGDDQMDMVSYGMDLFQRAMQSSKETITAFENDKRSQLLYFYEQLNDDGQKEAVKRLGELASLKQYTTSNTGKDSPDNTD